MHDFRTSAPGSLMLMGEHAVLHGQPALALAVNPRLEIRFRPRDDRDVHLQSALGTLEASLDNLPARHDLRFVLACLGHETPNRGFDAEIVTDLDSTRGLGTSAAVTVALLAGLRHLQGHPLDPGGIAARAREVIRQVQGRGSGCDAAASTFGGMVRVEPDPFRVEPLHAQAPFLMAYAGYKTPTAEVIAHVERLRAQDPDRFARCFREIGGCVEQTVEAIRQGDWEQVGELMNQHHQLQARIGTSDETLERLVSAFRSMDGVLGAKISGSGLGDSVLALGSADATTRDMEFTHVELSETGVTLDD